MGCGSRSLPRVALRCTRGYGPRAPLGLERRGNRWAERLAGAHFVEDVLERQLFKVGVVFFDEPGDRGFAVAGFGGLCA